MFSPNHENGILMGESNTFKFYAFSMRTDSKLTIDYLGISAAILIFDADAIAGFEEILVCDMSRFHCISWSKQIHE